MLELMYITNSISLAKIADAAGVDRIWIDLETKGKEERQKGLDTVKSHHTIADLARIRPVLRHAKLQCRINPMDNDSPKEIESVLAAGAEYIMLPYYKTVDEVRRFAREVSGRATTILLLETKEAVQILDETLAVPGVDEIHIGLNDLHLSLHETFLFEPLADGLVERICQTVRAAGKPYGFGGIARLGAGAVPAELVLAEHDRLGSTRAILSRSFCTPAPHESEAALRARFGRDLRALRACEAQLATRSPAQKEADRQELQQAVARVARAMRQQQSNEQTNGGMA